MMALLWAELRRRRAVRHADRVADGGRAAVDEIDVELRHQGVEQPVVEVGRGEDVRPLAEDDHRAEASVRPPPMKSRIPAWPRRGAWAGAPAAPLEVRLEARRHVVHDGQHRPATGPDDHGVDPLLVRPPAAS
jgi:hypothetical protein